MSPEDADPHPLYTFDTTNQAMWAEDVARERDIPAEVVSAPPEARARCGLALRTLATWAPALEAALREEGVPFTRADRSSPPS